MMFCFPLMCCEFRGILLLMRVQLIQRDMALCDSASNELKDALCIQLSVVEIPVNAKMFEPCTSCMIVVQIDIVDAMYSNRFSLSFLFHSDGILHCRDKPLFLQNPMPYSQTSEHSVTVGLTKTMMLIVTSLVVTLWGNLIHSCGYCQCLRLTHCGPHRFPLLSK